MKGLLIKDIALMKNQKNYFVIIFGITIFMSVFTEDVTFSMGFLPMVMSFFTLSTISYDEFDHGNTFLFTLPITREGYVMEKYVLGLLLGVFAWGIGLLCGNLAVLAGQSESFQLLLPAALAVLPMMLCMLALLIPIQLKFGSEKKQIASFVIFGILMLSMVLLSKAGEFFGVTPEKLLTILSGIHPALFMGGGVLVGILLLGISMKISINIMRKKEF